MRIAEILELVREGREGKITAMLLVIKDLGIGVVVFAFLGTALWFKDQAMAKAYAEYVIEIKDNKSAAWTIISQNSETQKKTADAVDRNTAAFNDLKDEIRRTRLNK